MAKLTLNVEPEVIQAAKNYAQAHHVSLSTRPSLGTPSNVGRARMRRRGRVNRFLTRHWSQRQQPSLVPRPGFQWQVKRNVFS